MESKMVPMPPVDDPCPEQPLADHLYPPQQLTQHPNPPTQPADQPYPQPGYIPCQYPVYQAPVITQQPAAYQQTSSTTVVINQQVVEAQKKARTWSLGLCDFCQDCDSCKYTAELFLCDHLPYPTLPSHITFVLVSEDLTPQSKVATVVLGVKSLNCFF